MLATPARAAHPALRLEVTIELEPAASCPPPAVLRDRLDARLGFVPEDGPDAVVARAAIQRHGDQVAGRLVIEGPEGASRTQLEVPAGDCASLIDALALAIALAVDPL